MWLLAHLSRWLVSEEFGAHELRTAEVERFLRARRAAGYTFLLSIKAMQPILGYLRGVAVVPPPSPPTPSGPVEGMLERYRSYLTVERGVGTETARGYVDAVRPFLQERLLSDGLALDLGHLTAARCRLLCGGALPPSEPRCGESDCHRAPISAGLPSC